MEGRGEDIDVHEMLCLNTACWKKWRFWMHWRTATRVLSVASTNGMKGMVSKGKLERVSVPATSSNTQARFGEVFDVVVALNRRQEVSLLEAQRLCDAVVQRAFSGGLDE